MKESSQEKNTLGIDIGGTNTIFGVVSPDGDILVRGSIPTSSYSTFPVYIQTLHKAVKTAAAEGGLNYDSIGAIGVGAPCLNSETGVIEGAVNLPWPSPLPLTALLSEVFGIPAKGENDANVAALGEMCYGAAKGCGNFIMLTLGTGVGSAIVCDGKLLHGKRGLAGEMGHIRVIHGENARLCNCGRRGCLDAYASARGLVKTAEELIATTDLPSVLRDYSGFKAKDIGEAAAGGDLLAVEALNITGRILGEACADFTAFSSPEAFFFFGGVANAFPLFEQEMRKTYKKNLLWVYEDQADFFHSTLPEADAALLGTAAVGRTML